LTETYLLDDVEVKFTGRSAVRQLRNNRTDERFEVTPNKSLEGTWKKWVRRTDLYIIENNNNNDNTIKKN